MSSLSVGKIVYAALNAAIGDRVTKIFPLIVGEAKLPYIAYRQSGMAQTYVKSGNPPDMATVDIGVFAGSYEEMNALAEAVRAALDYKQLSIDDGLRARIVTLVDAHEDWKSDAFVKTMVFQFKF